MTGETGTRLASKADTVRELDRVRRELGFAELALRKGDRAGFIAAMAELGATAALVLDGATAGQIRGLR